MTNFNDYCAYYEYATDLNGEMYVVQSLNPETGICDVADIVRDPRKAMDIALAEEANGMIPTVSATYYNQESCLESHTEQYDNTDHYEDWVA